MKKKPLRQKLKRILRLPDLDHAKSALLSTLTSSDSQRAYRFAIDDFVAWYCSEPRLAFNKTVVLRYRLQLSDETTRKIPVRASPLGAKLVQLRRALHARPQEAAAIAIATDYEVDPSAAAAALQDFLLHVSWPGVRAEGNDTSSEIFTGPQAR